MAQWHITIANFNISTRVHAIMIWTYMLFRIIRNDCIYSSSTAELRAADFRTAVLMVRISNVVIAYQKRKNTLYYTQCAIKVAMVVVMY